MGVFWGYYENEEARKARTPGKNFAWCQALTIVHHTGDRGETIDKVQRGKLVLRYGEVGELNSGFETNATQEVPLLVSGEKILVITIHGNRLVKANLGAVDLSVLCSDVANQRYLSEPHQGPLGVFSRGHSATFGNVRFIADSSN